MWMPMDGQGTKCHRNIAENFNRLSRAHERYRRQTDGRQQIVNVNVSLRSLKTKMLRRNGPLIKSVESVLRPEESLW